MYAQGLNQNCLECLTQKGICMHIVWKASHFVCSFQASKQAFVFLTFIISCCLKVLIYQETCLLHQCDSTIILFYVRIYYSALVMQKLGLGIVGEALWGSHCGIVSTFIHAMIQLWQVDLWYVCYYVLADGFFYPDVVKYKKMCRKAKYKEYKVHWCSHLCVAGA